MTEEQDAPKQADDPARALQERVTELDGLLDQLSALTDQLREQTRPESPTQ